MKRKELKNIAKKIAKYEKILKNTTDMAEKATAEQAIMKLSSSVDNFEDIFAIDELVLEYLAEDT